LTAPAHILLAPISPAVRPSHRFDSKTDIPPARQSPYRPFHLHDVQAPQRAHQAARASSSPFISRRSRPSPFRLCRETSGSVGFPFPKSGQWAVTVQYPRAGSSRGQKSVGFEAQ
jgi:hypothetical protein